MWVSCTIVSVKQSLWAYETVLRNTSPNFQNAVDVLMEVYCVNISHSKCVCYGNFVVNVKPEEYIAAEEGIFITLSKKALSKFLAWDRMNGN
jgi:hypothetical protein